MSYRVRSDCLGWKPYECVVFPILILLDLFDFFRQLRE
jgi:hypothetical protein